MVRQRSISAFRNWRTLRQLYFKESGHESEEAKIVIVDVLGRKVKGLSLSVMQDWNSIHMDVSDLPIGTYFMKLEGNRGATRFIIQE